MSERWTGVTTVLFDLDGTLLDSAPGIVAGFAEALRSVGIVPPDEAVLRSDLGPPLEGLLLELGVTTEQLPAAIDAYRTFYLREGRFLAEPYAGVRDVLGRLAERFPLAVATAKRTEMALATLQAHELDSFFTVVAGTDDTHLTKAQTIDHALERLGHPEPAGAVMVGDRHSDVTGGQACGVRTVGALWGYGGRTELESAGADVLLDRPAQLLDLLLD